MVNNMDQPDTGKYFGVYDDVIGTGPVKSNNSLSDSIKDKLRYAPIDIPKPKKKTKKKNSIDDDVEDADIDDDSDETTGSGMDFNPFGVIAGGVSGQYVADRYGKNGLQKGLIVGSFSVFGYAIQKYLEDKGFKIKSKIK
jgi:hypothetical protein